MDRQSFQKLVEEALKNLPTEFAEKLDNVALVVEDEPTKEQLLKLNLPPNSSLFGLYQGVPQIKRGSGYTMVSPDKISIFQKPIENFYHSEEDIKSCIRQTVLHEIGHHFGMSEKDLETISS